MSIIRKYENLTMQEQAMIMTSFSKRIQVAPQNIIIGFFPEASQEEIQSLIAYLTT